jgi:hypothetical protein
VNKSIRWRIISLQAVMVLVLAGGAGFAMAMGSFTTTQIHDELTAQSIYFPTADQIKTGGALDPAEFPQEIRDQAGNQVTDGNQARIYANDFLAKHLQGVAGGLTYATIGSKISAANADLSAASKALAAASKDDPTYATLQANVATAQAKVATVNGQRDTLFKGESLRSMLLNAYGWWTIGVYTTYAGIAFMIVAIGVLGALVFELFIAGRKPQTLKVAQKLAA